MVYLIVEKFIINDGKIMSLTESAKKLNQGDRAPEFSLPGIDGETHNLIDLRGSEGTLIIFMCNHCPYVRAKVDDMVGLHKKFQDKVAVIGVNCNDPAYPGEGMENMVAFAKERGIKFPYLLDERQKVATDYGATCTPDPFLFDKDLSLIFHGKINDAMQPDDTPTEQTMENNIEKHLQGEKIESWFDPSMGCSIKFTP